MEGEGLTVWRARRSRSRSLACCTATCLLAATAFASQTETTGIGARATALAGAVTASVADPTAVYYNPAGLTGLDVTQAWLDLTSFTVAGDSYSLDTEENFDFSLDPHIIRPTLIVGGPLPWEDLHWGFGLLGVAGLATRFPADFGENRFAGASAKILQTTLTPSLGWQVSEALSVGVTAEISALTKFSNRVRMGDGYVGKLLELRGAPGISTLDGKDDAHVHLDSDEDFPSGLRPNNDLAVDFRSATFVAGAIYRMTPRLSWGLSYKEESKPTMRGRGAFLFEEEVNQASGLPDPEADFEADFVVRPRMVNLGFAWEAVDGLVLHVEGQWSQWSGNRDLDIDFEGDGLLGQKRLAIPLRWHDTYSPRLGIEKIFASGKRLWLGYWFDKDPMPDRTYFAPFIPGDIHMASLGALFPSVFGEGIDIGVYGQVGFVDPRRLVAGESENAGGLKNPVFNDSGLAFGPNDQSLQYENARFYGFGFTITVPIETAREMIAGDSA